MDYLLKGRWWWLSKETTIGFTTSLDIYDFDYCI